MSHKNNDKSQSNSSEKKNKKGAQNKNECPSGVGKKDNCIDA